MVKRLIYIGFFCIAFLSLNAQKIKTAEDSLSYYDDLFSELDDFLDSITAPRSMGLLNIGVTNHYLNFTSKNGANIQAKQQLTFTPSLAYFDKNGLGITVGAAITNDADRLQPYQFLITGSFDYLQNTSFVTGLSFTRFITKDSLSFYTSPLKNEAAVYFTYKNWWIKPSVTATYGWGTRTDFKEREDHITFLRLRTNTYTRTNTEESVSDFSLATSFRHDFYWLNLLGNRNVIRITPQLVFTSGTQKFGFNETSNTYAKNPGKGNNIIYNSRNVSLDDKVYFQPLSMTAFLKSELSFGRFFIQPQFGVDYYFPATEKNISTALTLNTGLNF